MFLGKWPLPEATLYSRAMRRTNQGDMRLTGIWNFSTVEPELGGRYIFDYAIGAGGAPFDAVKARQFGSDFDDPPQAEYVSGLPMASRSLFSVDRPNVEIVTVKEAEGVPSAAIDPVNPAHAPLNRFVVRLQEIAGVATPRVRITLPAPILSAEAVNLTEEHVLRRLSPSPLIISLQPHQTVSVRVEIGDEKPQ
jgi:alpha-mannosidase